MYSTDEVARMAGLSTAQVRSFVRAGGLAPERGERGELRFSFQDLVLLRGAKGLVAARIPAGRVGRALARLRAQLPGDRPLSGVHLAADRGRVVVSDGDSRWQIESGQALFDFPEADAPIAITAIRRDPSPETAGAWYERGCDLEERSPDEAREAYRRALAIDPAHVDSLVNLGRLLHAARDLDAAVATFRRALALDPGEATAAFNLGVAAGDGGRRDEARAAYEQALAADPSCADAHYNLAMLLEHSDPAAALRHLKEYRRLTRR